MDKTDEFRVEVHLKWPAEDQLPALFANQFGIFSTGVEHVIFFGEFTSSLLLPGRTRESVVSQLNDAAINPVAKIVVTPEGLKAFYNLLKGYVEREGGTT